MGDKIVNIYNCDDAIEANVIKSKLESFGINCFLSNENFSSILPIYNNTSIGQVGVHILEKDIDQAIEILKITPEENIVEEKDYKCPECGSKDIKYGIGRNMLRKLFSLFLILLFIVPANRAFSVYYCKRCKSEFKYL